VRAAGLGLLCIVAVIAAGATQRSWTSAKRATSPSVVQAHLTGGALDPAVVILDRGPVHFEIANDGQEGARFVVRGPDTLAATAELGAGGKATLDVTLTHPGTYTLEAVSPSRGVTASASLEVRP
jgi:hypothetical protein